MKIKTGIALIGTINCNGNCSFGVPTENSQLDRIMVVFVVYVRILSNIFH